MFPATGCFLWKCRYSEKFPAAAELVQTSYNYILAIYLVKQNSNTFMCTELMWFRIEHQITTYVWQNINRTFPQYEYEFK